MKNIDWTKWSAIAEIVGSIAILVTLAYLAVQTAQNTAAVHASTRQAMMEADRELLALQFEFPEVLEYQSRERGSLTDGEKIRMSSWLVMFLRNRETHWLQWQNGVIDDTTWETHSSPLGPILSREIVRPWWDVRALSGEFDPEFVSYVNGVLSETTVQRQSISEMTDFD
jgi:hypothetical protein